MTDEKTGSARKEQYVAGVDIYSQALTWDVSKTLNSVRSDSDHMPCVIEQMSIGVDAYNFKLTGEIAATLNATSCDSPTHSGPSVLQRKCVGVDVYNQEITGEVAASLTAASGGSNTSGPKVLVINKDLCDKMEKGADTENPEGTVWCLQGNMVDRDVKQDGSGVRTDVSYTLDSVDHHAVAYNPTVLCLNDQGGSVMDVSHDVTSTLRAQEHGHQPLVVDARGNGNGKVAPTITGDHQDRITDYTAICVEERRESSICMSRQAIGDYKESEQATIRPGAGPNGTENVGVASVDCRNGTENKITNGTLQAKSGGGYNTNSNNILRNYSVVRRLTPRECERLQAMPDDWSRWGINEKGEVYELSDSARYRLQGNGIATPFFRWALSRIGTLYDYAPTMGSLFDGQASFPMIWEELYGKGTVLWSSEIEKHAVAVARFHFPDTD